MGPHLLAAYTLAGPWCWTEREAMPLMQFLNVLNRFSRIKTLMAHL